MGNIYETDPSELIAKVSVSLKALPELKAPAWAAFVKTGHFKERPPVNPDWWHMRAASILRAIYVKGPIGVSKLRTKYGGKKNRGVRPEHFYKGSGSIIRKILQQLEKSGLVKQVNVSGHKGRAITPQGIKLLSQAAPKKTVVRKETAETPAGSDVKEEVPKKIKRPARKEKAEKEPVPAVSPEPVKKAGETTKTAPE